jgi:hypothetical protein
MLACFRFPFFPAPGDQYAFPFSMSSAEISNEKRRYTQDW